MNRVFVMIFVISAPKNPDKKVENFFATLSEKNCPINGPKFGFGKQKWNKVPNMWGKKKWNKEKMDIFGGTDHPRVTQIFLMYVLGVKPI